MYGKILELGRSYKDDDDFEKPRDYGKRVLKRYIYLAVYIFYFLGFAVAVLVGC